MEIREIEYSEFKDVTAIHLNAFKGFFLTNLGANFLNVFYKSILKDDNSIKVGLYIEDELIGFAIGIKENSGFYNKLFKKNFFKLLIAALPNLMIKPQLILRLIISLTSSKKGQTNFSNSCTLLSICVKPNCSSKGLGKMLLLDFESKAFNFNNVITLTTDAINNDNVNIFYRNNGYKLECVFYQGQRPMNLYFKKKS